MIGEIGGQYWRLTRTTKWVVQTKEVTVSHVTFSSILRTVKKRLDAFLPIIIESQLGF